MGDNASFNMFVELKNQRRIPLEIGQLYLLGKQINGLENKSKHFIEVDVEEEVEQKHCVIDVGHNEDVFVYDLFSLNGTLLNNKPLKGMERLRLKNGDILKMGNQEIKFIHDQQEVSHDSSGFLEVNKNTSDIIASSPDSTSHPESRLKRNNYSNFLVPLIPPKKSITPNKSLVIPETEVVNISINSLNASSTSVSSNNRRSDSFTIPETQYCRARNSLNASDLSIAESIPDDNAKKINFNFGNLDDLEDDDFCIPETQEVLPPGAGITSSQRPRLLSNAKERSILVEETSNAQEDVEGSQFRICTQDYNEGFGEEAEAMQSQIIPLIKHNTVILNSSTNKLCNANSNASTKSCNESANNQSKPAEEEDKELSVLKWSNSKIDKEMTELRADCSTPDIIDFDDKEQPETTNEKDKLFTATNVMDEDEEDLLPTQAFPLPSTKTLANKSLKEQDKPCVDKEQEEVLTLSDKENRCPVTLEPITDLPPTQLFAINEVSSARSTTSSSSRNSLNAGLKTNTPPAVENKSLLKLDPDEEDDLLTQAFLQPSNPPISSTSTTNKNIPIKCFNSTVLEDKFITKNPHTFFAEMEKTPIKQTSLPAANVFKIPDKDFSVLKKASSATSTTSENDLELLMCTPQLIKDHMFMDKTEDLKKNILAAKNRNLFGEDTDDDKGDEDDDQEDLVKLINVPKDSLDFDRLLPHLNKKSPNSKEKKKKEETEAKEAKKLYKFNLSFGKEQEHTSISKSSTLSRDERHVARDKERELAERKERSKNKGESSNSHRRGRKPKETEETETSTKEDEQEKNASNKQDKPRQHRKRHAKEDKSAETAKEYKLEEKPKEEDKLEKKNDRKRQAKESITTETAKESKVEEKSKEMPARRMTRAKSRLVEAPSTSKEVASKNSTKTKQQEETEEGDDLDSIATQPFVVRLARRRSTSKQSESQSSITSNSSRKSSQHNKSKNDSSLSHNTSANGSLTTKLTGERKRKAESTPPVVPAKIERKRLRSTHSQDSTASTTSSSSKVLISMTMVDQEFFRSLVENSKGIWHVAKDPADSEILVMDKAFRTFKFLLAMARGIPIVTSEYLKKLNQTQSLKKVKINDYLFTDAEFEKKHKCSLVKSQQMAKKHKLFKGYEFVMTANILPNPREIQAIIEASGGYVHAKTPPAPKDNQKIYLVTSKEDKKDWHKFRRLNKNIVIVSTEAIMSAIMRQSCESMSSYTLA